LQRIVDKGIERGGMEQPPPFIRDVSPTEEALGSPAGYCCGRGSQGQRVRGEAFDGGGLGSLEIRPNCAPGEQNRQDEKTEKSGPARLVCRASDAPTRSRTGGSRPHDAYSAGPGCGTR